MPADYEKCKCYFAAVVVVGVAFAFAFVVAIVFVFAFIGSFQGNFSCVALSQPLALGTRQRAKAQLLAL